MVETQVQLNRLTISTSASAYTKQVLFPQYNCFQSVKLTGKFCEILTNILPEKCLAEPHGRTVRTQICLIATAANPINVEIHYLPKDYKVIGLDNRQRRHLALKPFQGQGLIQAKERYMLVNYELCSYICSYIYPCIMLLFLKDILSITMIGFSRFSKCV